MLLQALSVNIGTHSGPPVKRLIHPRFTHTTLASDAEAGRCGAAAACHVTYPAELDTATVKTAQLRNLTTHTVIR